jgi:hypothetical protein
MLSRSGRRHVNLDDGSLLADNGLEIHPGSYPRPQKTAPSD